MTNTFIQTKAKYEIRHMNVLEKFLGVPEGVVLLKNIFYLNFKTEDQHLKVPSFLYHFHQPMNA